jgi:hypothetical protein
MGQNKEIALIQDFAAKGNLFRFLRRPAELTPERLKSFFANIVCLPRMLCASVTRFAG